ncbi:MAG: hypothetical protein BroJett030_25490 [Alphaproteobacteria bacterium]|nr:MAG: hypothetical protein BroJett030_25490 [Alphaproteobacteria bacterium]
MRDFNDLLEQQGIDLRDVNIARHTPEPALRGRFGRIASELPELFEYYQSTQSPRREAMLLKRNYLASFIGQEDGSTIFVGVYRKVGFRHVKKSVFESDRRFQKLMSLGCSSYPEEERLVFDFMEIEAFKPMKGRIEIGWRAPRSFIQVAAKRSYPILRIADDNRLVR